MRRILSFLAVIALFCPFSVFALEQRSVTLPGYRITVEQALNNIVSFLGISIIGIAAVLFLVGSVFLVVSAGKPELLEQGKKTMRGAVIGMAIVLASYAILRTVLFFLY